VRLAGSRKKDPLESASQEQRLLTKGKLRRKVLDKLTFIKLAPLVGNYKHAGHYLNRSATGSQSNWSE
jgi:hypothetical protein